MSKVILGIQLQQRHEIAKEVQEVLTKFGCTINTRIGVHQTSKDSCIETGLIILELMDGADSEAIEMEESLSKIKDVVVKKMVF